MARKIWNFGKLCDEVDSAHAAIDPLLTKANISTITVDGKPVAAAEVPLKLKIDALAAVMPTTAGNQAENELMVTNATLAAQIEKVSGELATANATGGKLTLEARDLTTRATNAEASVQTLTAEKGQLDVQLKASNSEFSRVNTSLSAISSKLSKACIGVGCLQLLGENGGPLPANATEAQKITAADKIPIAEKLEAYQGALNTAISNVGLSVASIPGAPLKLEAGSPKGIRAQYAAIPNASEKTAFYRANKTAIDASYREKGN